MNEKAPIITVIQTRRGSSRLPDKVLMPVQGKPLFLRQVERVAAARLAGRIIVATTLDPPDDVIEEICRQEGLDCFRGHATDVLDRHYQAALQFPADAVIKIPSDCPLIDPAVIDRVIGFYFTHLSDFDFVSNLHPATYPDGNDVEIMPFATLERAWREARRPMEREHTTPYIWENPDLFRIGNVVMEGGVDHSMTHRFTIDYAEDYAFIRTVFDELYPGNPRFGVAEILELLERRPEIYAINAQYAGVNWYRHHLDELKTVGVEHTKQI
ncbi:MAG TPA: glycosyltransferase family protein [Puia sp.]|nr:glycosyltransferase family protein [Puia sp.]